FGSGEQDASNFVHKGVIAVTLNYRLGALGWLAHPEMTAEGGGSSSNYGLWDQILALQWVHDNITIFGGDPGNVTLTGFSSAAGAPYALMASPIARGLFVRAAPSSAGYWQIMSPVSFQSLATNEDGGVFFSQQVGCDTAPDPLACMRALSAEVITDAWGRGSV